MLPHPGAKGPGLSKEQMMRGVRRAVVGGVLLVGLSGSGLAVAQEDSPRTQGVQVPQAPIVCTGTVRATYDPPVSGERRDTRARGDINYDKCTVLTGEKVVSGSSHYDTVIPNFSCDALLNTAPETLKITWKLPTCVGGSCSRQETSTLILQRQSVALEGAALVVTFEGTVMEGKYKGATVIRQNTYVNAQVTDSCLTGGCTREEAGPSILTITPVSI